MPFAFRNRSSDLLGVRALLCCSAACHRGRALILGVFAVLSMLCEPRNTEAAVPPLTGELAEIAKMKVDPQQGAAIFKVCTECHGAQGTGTEDGIVPAISGQYFEVIVKELLDYRDGRRWDTRMRIVASRHTLTGAREMADVADYVSRLSRGAPAGQGSAEFLSRGRTVYLEFCSSCHGRDGRGNAARVVPSLAGQHYEYLLRQMYDAVSGNRPNLGRAHVRLLGDLGSKETKGIADFLSRLPQSSARTDQVNP